MRLFDVPAFLRFAIMLCVMCPIAAGISKAQDKPAAKKQAVQDNTRYWNLSWSWEDIDVQQLSRRLSSVGLDIPIAAEGNAKVDVEVGIPLNALRTPEKYRLNGAISSSELRVDGLVCRDFQALVDVRDGVASLTKLTGVIGSGETAESVVDRGRVIGSARLKFAPMGNLFADLDVSSLDVGPLHQVYQAATGNNSDVTFEGTIDGRVQFSAPYNSLSDLAAWDLDADVSVQQFRSGALPAVNLATGPLTIRGGELNARAIRLSLAGDASIDAPPSQLMMATHAELTGKRRFEVGVVGDNVPLTSIAKLAAAEGQAMVVGQLDIDLTARGQLGNGDSDWADLGQMNWKVDGEIASPQLSVAGVDLGLLEHQVVFDETRFELVPLAGNGLDQLIINRVAAQYELSSEAFRLENLNADVFGGSVRGEAVFSIGSDQAHELDLAWGSLGIRFDTSAFMPIAADFQANTSGKIQWSVPANAITQLDQHVGTLSVQVEDIELSKVAIGQIEVVAKAGANVIQLKSKGNLFGGELSIESQADVTPGMTFSELLDGAMRSTIAITSMDAGRVLTAIPADVSPEFLRRRWRGKLSAKAEYLVDPNSDAKGNLEAVIENLSLDGKSLARRIKVISRLVDDRVMVDQVVGLIADGRFDSNGRIAFDWQTGRVQVGQFSVRATRIDGQQLIGLFAPSLAKQIDGRVSARLVLSGGDRDRLGIRGAISLGHATLFGIHVDEAHSDVAGWVTSRVDRWKFDLPSIVGVTGNGQLAGKLQLKSANRPSRVDMRSRWDLRRVDFAKALDSEGAVGGTLGDGRLSGKLTLNADNLSGPNELFGNFDFRLDGSSGRSIPGLADAQSFLGPIGLAGIQFDEGRGRGVIGGGRATIEEFWLRSPQMMVWAEGAVILASQRLDLEAVLSTGNFDTNTTLVSAISLLAIDYATPIGILLEINQLLSNRTIFVDVVGPASDPRLRLKPVETIRNEVARFFLDQLLPAPCQLNQQQSPLDR